MASDTHLQRTTKILRGQGLKYWKVEYHNTWAKKKVDLFHIIDLLVLDGGFLGIQVCGKDWQEHVKKITHEYRDNTIEWLNSGGRIELWGWRKIKKKRGGKVMIWMPRIADVLLVNGGVCLEEREVAA
jgi:hypothetical protein